MPAVLPGEVDITNSADVADRLLGFVREQRGSRVEVDCSAVTFIDSSGLNMLVHVQNESGKVLVLRGLDQRFQRLFELTGLADLFEFE